MSGMNRREWLVSTVVLALSAFIAGCGGGGGGSGSGNGGGGGGGGGGGTTTVLGATSAAGASITYSPTNYSFGQLVTGVSLNGSGPRGDLNYNPWQGVSAASAQVQRGTSVTWAVNGQGSGNSVSVTA